MDPRRILVSASALIGLPLIMVIFFMTQKKPEPWPTVGGVVMFVWGLGTAVLVIWAKSKEKAEEPKK